MRHRHAPDIGDSRAHTAIWSRGAYQVCSGGIANVASWASNAVKAGTSQLSHGAT